MGTVSLLERSLSTPQSTRRAGEVPAMATASSLEMLKHAHSHKRFIYYGNLPMP